MTVVPFEAARRRLRPLLAQGWLPDEKGELMELYAVLKVRGAAAGCYYGETERREPQFYILGTNPARSCIACASRLSEHGRPWYVIEDGAGGLLGEGSGLVQLVSRVSRRWRSLVGDLLLFAPVLAQLLTDGDLVEEGVALAVGVPLDGVPVAGILSWTAQALALA